MRYRCTFDGDRWYTFRMALSADGVSWQPLIDVGYRRQ